MPIRILTTPVPVLRKRPRWTPALSPPDQLAWLKRGPALLALEVAAPEERARRGWTPALVPADPLAWRRPAPALPLPEPEIIAPRRGWTPGLSAAAVVVITDQLPWRHPPVAIEEEEMILSLRQVLVVTPAGGSGPAPVVPALTVTDKGDGTGATATILGSSTGSANVVNALSPSNVLTGSGSRTGDGTLSLSLPVGSYFAYDASTLNSQSVASNVVWFAVTDGSLFHQLTDILLAIQARLIAFAVVTASQVQLVIKEEQLIPRYQAQYQVLIRPMGFLPVEGPNAAGGRRDARVRRRIRLYLRTQNSYDQADQEGAYLTNAAVGALNLEERVLNALHIAFSPLNADNTEMLAEPMRVLVDSEYVKARGDDNWGSQVIDFEAAYDLRLDETYQ